MHQKYKTLTTKQGYFTITSVYAGTTGRFTLNTNGDRIDINYAYWMIAADGNWYINSKYDASTGTIIP